MGDTNDDSDASGWHGGIVCAPQLVVVLECDRPLAGGARYGLDAVDVVTIGRGADRSAARRLERGMRTLDLRVPGRSVSAAHARLVRVGSSWAIEDVGSTNGTLVNGDRVARAVLGAEDVFQVGRTLMRVNPSLAMPAGAPVDLEARGARGEGHVTLAPALAAEFERGARLLGSGVPVVMVGESGTGKEVLARWLHARTGRSGDLVAVNCGAIPATLVESQLFGHVRGAFSGAIRDERGLIRAAHGGTLFLDEVADLPLSSQAVLLRVIQEAEVLPVGATKAIKVDFRLIAATHRPLEKMAERGEFRRDLFARLAGFVLALPPLRDRLDDLGVLVGTLLQSIAGDRAAELAFAPEAGRALVSHDWPLNIRELERCLATSVALAADGRIRLPHLPRAVAEARRPARLPMNGGAAPVGRDEALRLDVLERLSRHQGNLAAVAREVGKAPMQVHRWCKRFGIDPRLFRG